MATAGAIGTKIAFSHVDMVKRLEELAKAAGVEPPTMPEIERPGSELQAADTCGHRVYLRRFDCGPRGQKRSRKMADTTELEQSRAKKLADLEASARRGRRG